MDRKTLLAMLLCFGIFMGWQKFYIEPRLPKQPVAGQTSSAPSAPSAPSNAPTSLGAPAAVTPAAKHPPQTRKIESGTGTAILGDGSKAFVGWDLKAYKLGITPQAANVDLKSVTHQEGQVELAFDDPAFAYLKDVQGEFQATPQGVLWTYEDANVKLSRQITGAPEQAYLGYQIMATFKAKRPNYAFVSLTSESFEKDPEAQDRALLYWSDKSLERVHLNDTIDKRDVITPVKYVGATNRYFLLTLVADGPLEAKGQVQPIGPSAGRISLVYPVASDSITIPLRAFFGPKELEILRKVDPALDNTVDLGWFQAFAYPLLWLLKTLYKYVHNYGIAIILLTILVKLLTYPLTFKSMKSMKEMAKLQPQLAKIREKYKDDKEALNREMLTVMRTHGYNPLAGCLPMIIQMPIFFALYRVLYSSIELLHAPFAVWIRDLSAQDPYYVTPVLLTGTMYLQQKLSPQTATDPAQQKMMQFMPIMFGLFMINLPSGLTIYMLTNAIASIVQQLYMNKKLDAPRTAVSPA